MDILAHTLWAGAGAKAINLKKEKTVKVGWAAFFGVFPDLFAFTLSFTWYFAASIFSFIPPIGPMHPGITEPPNPDTVFVMRLTHELYNYSHSLMIFLAVFLLVWIWRKRPMWELGGWLLHILIDIPSHSYAFYPTPFLWPFSDYKFNGYSWAHPMFMAVNYSLLLITYITFTWLRFKKMKRMV